MKKPGMLLKRVSLLVGIGLMTVSNSGCVLLADMMQMAWVGASFFGTTPPIPVSPYYSELIEDTYKREERYDKVPVLDPVEGEHAPYFCQDPPLPDEVMMALPNETSGGWSFLAETARNNVRIVVEPIVDRMDECRFYPMVGPARLHHCHYKCTVYYDKIMRSDWPVPFKHVDETIQVVYIDHDHLIRCVNPEATGSLGYVGGEAAVQGGAACPPGYPGAGGPPCPPGYPGAGGGMPGPAGGF